MQDMQFIELRTMNREIIREAYRIHQAMLGISVDVNRANAQTAEEVHVAWHEITRLERTRNVLNEFFLPMFGETGKGVEFDFEDPSPTSANEVNDELTAKTKAAQVLVMAGYEPHAVLECVGLPDMPWVGIPAPAPVALPGAGAESGAPAAIEAGRSNGGPVPAIPPPADRPAQPTSPTNTYVLDEIEVEHATMTLRRGLEAADANKSQEFADVLLEMLKTSRPSLNGHRKELV
jgi:hypothetical protein